MVHAVHAHGERRRPRRPHLEVHDLVVAWDGPEHGADVTGEPSACTAILVCMNHLKQFASRNPGHRHRVLRRRVATVLVIVVVADVVGAVLMYHFEKGADGGQIHAFTDALFFATVQLLTISSQMPNPVTGAGRITDVGLELFGLFVVTALAGSFASFFLQVGEQKID